MPDISEGLKKLTMAVERLTVAMAGRAEERDALPEDRVVLWQVSSRARKAMARLRVKTLADFEKQSPNDFFELRNIGVSTVMEIRKEIENRRELPPAWERP